MPTPRNSNLAIWQSSLQAAPFCANCLAIVGSPLICYSTRDMPLSTEQPEYTERLQDAKSKWKKLLPVQAPYRWNLRRLAPGFTLDIGCGIGRNLLHLDGTGAGVDHNPSSVAEARARGLRAFTPEEFRLSEFNRPGLFDAMLVAHVLEHMPEADAVDLVVQYADLVKEEGKLILLTPQELGFKSDPTHIRFMDFTGLRQVARAAGFAERLREYSFPFPRRFGAVFKYNEFVGTYGR